MGHLLVSLYLKAQEWSVYTVCDCGFFQGMKFKIEGNPLVPWPEWSYHFEVLKP